MAKQTMSSLYCATPHAVVYVVCNDDFRTLVRERLALAQAINLVCIGYLANQVQHAVVVRLHRALGGDH